MHLLPVAGVIYFGAAMTVDPADFAVTSTPSAPLEFSLVRQENPLDFQQPELDPVKLPETEPPLEFEREKVALKDEVEMPPLTGKPSRPEPVLDRPLRATAEPLKRPTPPSQAPESVPSVETETLPVQIHNPPPEYPLPARRRRLEGAVVVEVTVLEDGSAGEVRVVEGGEQGLFANAAIQAVKTWTFQPAFRGGKAVRSTERIRFVFKLSNR
jgi:protein TonB